MLFTSAGGCSTARGRSSKMVPSGITAARRIQRPVLACLSDRKTGLTQCVWSIIPLRTLRCGFRMGKQPVIARGIILRMALSCTLCLRPTTVPLIFTDTRSEGLLRMRRIKSSTGVSITEPGRNRSGRWKN